MRESDSIGDWLRMDGVMTKAPLGGEKTGPNPTDRGKSGTKRSLIVEGHGVPMGIARAGANENDHKIAGETIEARLFAPPPDLWHGVQNLCLDAGYDTYDTRVIITQHGLVAHIRPRREEIEAKRRNPRAKARRWVLERTHSWMNKFRSILIRWSKKATSFEGLIQFACATITLQQAGELG